MDSGSSGTMAKDIIHPSDEIEHVNEHYWLKLDGELLPTSIHALISALREMADLKPISNNQWNISPTGIMSVEDVDNGLDSFDCLNLKLAKKRSRYTQSSNVIVISNTVPSLNKKHAVAATSKNPFRVSSSTASSFGESLVGRNDDDSVPNGVPFFKLTFSNLPNFEKIGYSNINSEIDTVYQLDSIAELKWGFQARDVKYGGSKRYSGTQLKLRPDMLEVLSLKRHSLEGLPAQKVLSCLAEVGDDEILDPVKVYHRFAE